MRFQTRSREQGRARISRRPAGGEDIRCRRDRAHSPAFDLDAGRLRDDERGFCALCRHDCHRDVRIRHVDPQFCARSRDECTARCCIRPTERRISGRGRLVSFDDRHFPAAAYSVYQIVVKSHEGHFQGRDRRTQSSAMWPKTRHRSQQHVARSVHDRPPGAPILANDKFHRIFRMPPEAEFRRNPRARRIP